MTTNSGTLFARLFLIFAPLGIAGILLGQFFMDKTDYTALIKYNLLTVYTGAFLAAFVQTMKNKSHNKTRRNAGCD